MVPVKFVGRTIARSVFEQLHEGLQRSGKLWRWQVVPDEDLKPESNPLTLAELGQVDPNAKVDDDDLDDDDLDDDLDDENGDQEDTVEVVE